FQAEDGIRDFHVTGVQTCALPISDFWADPQRARATAVMGEVLSLRLTDELREAQGATYSPSVGYSHSMTWPGWGYVSASVEVPRSEERRVGKARAAGRGAEARNRE